MQFERETSAPELVAACSVALLDRTTLESIFIQSRLNLSRKAGRLVLGLPNEKVSPYWNHLVFEKLWIHSLISMRPIYYFDTWPIYLTGHCLFMGFSSFLLVLVWCYHKIILHWYENQNKHNLAIIACCSNHCKSREIIRNQLTI